MKTSAFCSFLLILTFAVTSCKKEFPDDPFALKDLSVSDCKTKADNAKGLEQEYITLKTIDDYYLLFNHFNSIFNCEPGEITVSVEITSNEISITEKESTAMANCVCPYDLEFKLGPLQYGSYKIIFKKAGLIFKEYNLDFKKSTDIKIDL
jgi:hypothetical protein